MWGLGPRVGSPRLGRTGWTVKGRGGGPDSGTTISNLARGGPESPGGSTTPVGLGCFLPPGRREVGTREAETRGLEVPLIPGKGREGRPNRGAST